MINQTYSSKNGIVENNFVNNSEEVLLRLEHSKNKGEVK